MVGKIKLVSTAPQVTNTATNQNWKCTIVNQDRNHKKKTPTASMQDNI
jgi:hypothetical protein